VLCDSGSWFTVFEGGSRSSAASTSFSVEFKDVSSSLDGLSGELEPWCSHMVTSSPLLHGERSRCNDAMSQMSTSYSKLRWWDNIAASFFSIVAAAVYHSRRIRVPTYVHQRAVNVCTYPTLGGALSIMQSLLKSASIE